MNMKPHRWLPAALAAVIAVFALGARADQLADIKSKGEIVIGVLGTDEPYSFIDPRTRDIVGYDVDLGIAIARRIGVKPVIKQLAVAARIPELQQGRVDLLAASLTHTRERESQIAFSLTTFVTGQKVMVKKRSGITALAQLAGRKVLTVKGGTQDPNIRRAVPGVEVVTFETAQQAFLALQQGKGVAYVNDEASLLDDYAKVGAADSGYVILPQNISVEPLALGLRRNEPALKAVVDDTLRELERSGEAEKLFFKWFGPTSRLRFDKRDFRFDSDQVTG
jgi:polar amino acid transport system substrate-binding protein